jgi:hypothetical protein
VTTKQRPLKRPLFFSFNPLFFLTLRSNPYSSIQIAYNTVSFAALFTFAAVYSAVPPSTVAQPPLKRASIRGYFELFGG